MDLDKIKQKQMLYIFIGKYLLNSIVIEYIDGFNSKSNLLEGDQLRYLFIKNLQYFIRNI